MPGANRLLKSERGRADPEAGAGCTSAIDAYGRVGDIAGAAQRLKEVRIAIAYALKHRVKPEIAVEQADAVRPKAQEAVAKVLKRREQKRETYTRGRVRREKELAISRVQVAALTGWGDDLQSGVRDLRERLAASEANGHRLRAAISSDGLQNFGAASVDRSGTSTRRQVGPRHREALTASGRYDTAAAAADALGGNADAWAELQASHGVSEGCAAVRVAIGRHQAVSYAVRHGAAAFNDPRLEHAGLRRRATPATPATPKRRKVAAPAPATSVTSATPATPPEAPKRSVSEKLIKWKLNGCTVAVTPITVVDEDA